MLLLSVLLLLLLLPKAVPSTPVLLANETTSKLNQTIVSTNDKPHVYCVNLDKAYERKKIMQSILNNCGYKYTRIKALVPKDLYGEISLNISTKLKPQRDFKTFKSCTISHLKAIYTAVRDYKMVSYKYYIYLYIYACTYFTCIYIYIYIFMYLYIHISMYVYMFKIISAKEFILKMQAIISGIPVQSIPHYALIIEDDIRFLFDFNWKGIYRYVYMCKYMCVHISIYLYILFESTFPILYIYKYIHVYIFSLCSALYVIYS
jgi:hypothetical protein